MAQPVIRAKQPGDHGKNPTDVHKCPACPHTVEGPAVTGSPNVELNGKPVVRVCDRGIHDAKCCDENAWEAIEGAATVEVNGRPVVRRGDKSQHCGGNGALIGGSPDCEVGGPAAQAPLHTADELAKFIQKEMSTNAKGPHAAELQKLTGSYWPNDQFSAYRKFGLLTWPATQTDTAKKVLLPSAEEEKSIAAWDHKPVILKNYGKWAYDPKTNTSYCHDVWSNIHFGYIGAASGFSDWALKSGAGAGQLLAGNANIGFSEYWRRRFETLGDADVLSAFDDPKDQEAIKTGIDLWKKHGANVTQDQILDAMRASGNLCSRSGMMRC